MIYLGTEIPYLFHSPNLTPADAYVWGMLKEVVFREQPPAIIGELHEKMVPTVRVVDQNLSSETR